MEFALALTNAEKQARFRAKRDAELKALRKIAAQLHKPMKKTATVKKAKATKKKGGTK